MPSRVMGSGAVYIGVGITLSVVQVSLNKQA